MDQHHYHPKRTLNRLENIEEEDPTSCFSTSLPPPETPTETMEFLARSWSLSSLELSKAVSDAFLQSHGIGSSIFNKNGVELMGQTLLQADEVERDSISDRSSLGVGPLISMKETQDVKAGKSRMRGKKRMCRWLKDHKDRKKEEIRTHNAQLHAATSVAGVAAAIAAIMAACSMSADTSEDGSAKTSTALVSAAALVASHCVNIAEEMGADRDQILTAMSSAVNSGTYGDIMTLTAGAATALRGAATLRSRFQKEMPTLGLDPNQESNELTPEDENHEICSALSFVTGGGELLKRTRKGVLHWKQVSLYINSNSQEVSKRQVVIKMKSKHMAGTFVKKKRSVVFDICCDIPAWGDRDGEEDRQQKAYFGIKTVERLIEFECRNKHEKQMWIDGIRQMLQY